MNALKNDMKTIQGITFEAYKTSGTLLALLDSRDADPNSVADALDKMSAGYESGGVALRNLCEKNHPGVPQKGAKRALPHIKLSGKAEVNDYGWLHIELNTLLPNCRFQTPAYLTDTYAAVQSCVFQYAPVQSDKEQYPARADDAGRNYAHG